MRLLWGIGIRIACWRKCGWLIKHHTWLTVGDKVANIRYLRAQRDLLLIDLSSKNRET